MTVFFPTREHSFVFFSKIYILIKKQNNCIFDFLIKNTLLLNHLCKPRLSFYYTFLLKLMKIDTHRNNLVPNLTSAESTTFHTC